MLISSSVRPDAGARRRAWAGQLPVQPLADRLPGLGGPDKTRFVSGAASAYFTLANDPLVWLIHALDPILELAVVLGQAHGDLVRTARDVSTDGRRELHDLPDPKFVD
jgi:hypothetical protein